MSFDSVFGTVLARPSLPEETSQDLGSWLSEVLHELPHISYRLHLVGDRFNPNESEYFQALSMYLVPFVCVGALLLVVGMVYAIYRCVCFNSSEYKYMKWHRTFFRVMLVVLTLVMILACGPGIWASVETTRSGPYIANRLQDSVDFLVDSSEAVLYSLQTLQGYMNGSYSIVNIAVHNSGRLQNDLSEKDNILTTELARNVVVICLYGAIVLACMLGLVAALFGWGAPSLLMVFMLWLLLSLAWLVCGLHMATAVGVSDFCITGDDYLAYEYFSDNSSVAFIEYYMFCSSSALFSNVSIDGQQLLARANASYYEALAKNNTEDAAQWLQVWNQTQELLHNVRTLANCSGTARAYNEAKGMLCSDVM